MNQQNLDNEIELTDFELRQIKREEQNWDVHGIPEDTINLYPEEMNDTHNRLELTESDMT